MRGSDASRSSHCSEAGLYSEAESGEMSLTLAPNAFRKRIVPESRGAVRVHPTMHLEGAGAAIAGQVNAPKAGTLQESQNRGGFVTRS
jgi:hypothetical protein